MSDLIDTAILRLKEAAGMSERVYHRPLLLTYSGGKDSEVCLRLLQMSGLPFDVLHSHTTADAPETVYHVRNRFKTLEAEGIDCTVQYPVFKGARTSMWQLIPAQHTPPTRLRRYCCTILKETGGARRFTVTGVRWAESTKRRNHGIYETVTRHKGDRIMLNSDNDDRRMLFETCMLRRKRAVNPIIDWTDRDVWDFIQSERLPLNPLYCEGFSRVGCIGCPMAGKHRNEQFARYPKYRDMYISAFGRMLVRRKEMGKPTQWKDALDVYRWWMEEETIPGQVHMDDAIQEDEIDYGDDDIT